MTKSVDQHIVEQAAAVFANCRAIKQLRRTDDLVEASNKFPLEQRLNSLRLAQNCLESSLDRLGALLDHKERHSANELPRGVDND